MKRLSNLIGLKKEAVLFDSRLYIFKAILAIATGYILGKSMPITRLDMISVLLGVMYNLEPINILGIKGGINQLIASTLGAACTSILIVVFGINVVTVSIGMALTLFLSLKINWRMISPVAIFTCIYMTQYVQLDAAGNPSIWLTYRLRMAALGLGVLIAILYNFIFSFMYYRKISYKRLQFSKNQLLYGLEYTQRQLEEQCGKRDRKYITLFPAIFDDLDMVYSNISLMINESRYSLNMMNQEKLKTVQKVLQYFRDINHLAYDINFVACRGKEDSQFDRKAVVTLKSCISTLKSLDFTLKEPTLTSKDYNVGVREYSNTRINSNIDSINSFIELVLEESINL